MLHLISLMLFVFVLNLPYQIIRSHPVILEPPVRDVVFGPANTVWVLLKNREIAKTTDGGTKWEHVSNVETGKPDCIFFIDHNQGWSIDNKGTVRRTFDGGQKWKSLSKIRLSDPYTEVGPMLKLEFIDEMHGWAFDPFTLWQTKDGGFTWQEVKGMQVSFLHFINQRVGWICERSGALHKTVDGGKSWQKQEGYEIETSLLGISFANERKGWLCMGQGGGILHTTDGGRSWAKQNIPGREVRVTSVQFLNENEGWATGVDFAPEGPVKFWFKSMLLHTIDGGETWQIASTVNGNEWYHKIHFSDTQLGWLYTDTGLYRTMDGGQVWNLVLQYPRPDYKLD